MLNLEEFLVKNYKQAIDKQVNVELNNELDNDLENYPLSKQLDKQLHMKQAIVKCLGEFPEIKAAFTVTRLERVVFATHIREKMLLRIEGHPAMPIYVLTPLESTEKLPAVLALHGHGYGSKEIVGLTASGEEDEGATIHQHFAVKLVQQGIKVIAPEVIGFGERMLDIDIHAKKPCSCYRLSTHLLVSGKTLAGLRIAEALRIIDFMETLADIDQQRLGIMGFSGGGLIASYTAALDQRIKAAVLCGFTSTFQASILHDEHCIDNYIPGILNVAELPQIVGLIAPRKLFIESGYQDKVFPIEGVKAAIEQLEQVFAMYGAEAALATDLFEGVHEINGRQAYSWLKAALID